MVKAWKVSIIIGGIFAACEAAALFVVAPAPPQFNGGLMRWRQQRCHNCDKHAAMSPSRTNIPHLWARDDKGQAGAQKIKRGNAIFAKKEGDSDIKSYADSSAEVRKKAPRRQENELFSIRRFVEGLLYAAVATARQVGIIWVIFKLFANQWPQQFFPERVAAGCSTASWTAVGLSCYVGWVFHFALRRYCMDKNR